MKRLRWTPSSRNRSARRDPIVCRNVKIYFGPDLMRRVVGQFHDCLVPRRVVPGGSVRAAKARLRDARPQRDSASNRLGRERATGNLFDHFSLDCEHLAINSIHECCRRTKNPTRRSRKLAGLVLTSRLATANVVVAAGCHAATPLVTCVAVKGRYRMPGDKSLGQCSGGKLSETVQVPSHQERPGESHPQKQPGWFGPTRSSEADKVEETVLVKPV